MLNRLLIAVVLALTFLTLATVVTLSWMVLNQTKAQLPEKTAELVIYSAAKGYNLQPIVDKFAAANGIKVKLVAEDESLVGKLMMDRYNVAGDIIFAANLGALEYLRQARALQPYSTSAAALIAAEYKPPDNCWYPLGTRAGVIIYNSNLVEPADRPLKLWDLTDPKWKGQVIITRGGHESMVSQVTALQLAWGEERTQQWLRMVTGNAGAITQEQWEIWEAVASGEYKIGMVDDNWLRHEAFDKTSVGKTYSSIGIIYPDQGADDMGAFVNISGLGILKGAPNLANARAFMDFVLQPEQQVLYAKISGDLPLLASARTPEVRGLFKPQQLKTLPTPFAAMGSSWNRSFTLIEEAGKND